MFRKWSKYNIKYSLKEIKNICDVDNIPYEVYKDFRRWVLDPVVTEINRKLNMEVRYELIKEIRKVKNKIYIYRLI